MSAGSSRRGLLAGAAGIAAGGIVAGAKAEPGLASSPDAELIACCATGIAADDQSMRFFDQTDDMLVSDPRWQPLHDEGMRILQPYFGAVERAADLPARNPEGMRAKAALALRVLSSSGHDFPLVASVLRDMAGRA